jgi:exonuclease III
MKAVSWNIRGFGRRARHTQLKEYIKKEAIDIIFL